ncbi:hypothetical protein ACSBR1_017929 [Camellia fascicularis]
MASSATPSTLMLSHDRFLSSSPTPHPLSLLQTQTTLLQLLQQFLSYPLVLHFTHTKSNNWIDVSSPNSPVVVAALAAEAELAEETEQLQEGAVVTLNKPKKGKAALPLKSDRRRSKRFLEIQKLRENKKV